MQSTPAQYGQDFAEVYDLLYVDGGIKDYAAEASALTALVRERNPGAASLLDVACGTGEHLRYLRRAFGHVEGVDLAAPMLAVAAAKLPGVTLHRADMRALALPRRFDAVVCLFGAIGYLRSVDELHAAVGRMTAHLNPGGVLIVEPWIYPDLWQDGAIGYNVAQSGTRTLLRMSASEREGRLSRLVMHYLLGDENQGVRYFSDVHELTLFTPEEYLDAFAGAGLHAVERVAGWSRDRDRFVGVLSGAV